MAVFQEQEYNKPFDFKVWKKMLPFLRPYYVNLFIVIVLNIVMALIDISMPLFQRYTIDHYIGGGTLEGIGWFTLLYAAAIVFQTVVVIISTRQSMFIEMKTNRDMKRACFVHLQKLSFSFYNVTPIGYLIARVMSDTGRISGMLARGLMDVMEMSECPISLQAILIGTPAFSRSVQYVCLRLYITKSSARGKGGTSSFLYTRHPIPIFIRRRTLFHMALRRARVGG